MSWASNKVVCLCRGGLILTSPKHRKWADHSCCSNVMWIWECCNICVYNLTVSVIERSNIWRDGTRQVRSGLRRMNYLEFSELVVSYCAAYVDSSVRKKFTAYLLYVSWSERSRRLFCLVCLCLNLSLYNEPSRGLEMTCADMLVIQGQLK